MFVTVFPAIAAKRRYIVHHFDAKTAFLNGDLEEVLFINQPPGFEIEGEEHIVCLLKERLYGIKQAARTWNQAMHGVYQADPRLYSKVFGDQNVFVPHIPYTYTYIYLHIPCGRSCCCQ